MRGQLLFTVALGVSALACSRATDAVRAALPAEAHVADAGVEAIDADAGGTGAGGAGVLAEAERPRSCEASPGVFLFASPAIAVAGAPVRVLAVSDKPLAGELRVASASGPVAATDARRGGPPYFWLAELAAPAAGALSVTFAQPACADGAEGAATALEVRVRKGRPAASAPPKSGVWSARRAWSRSFENVYSAWIEALFDAPADEQPSWGALHEVLRDPRRNLLFDHLGLGEDSGRAAPVARPDCADLPYFLRAYFAWKLGLPFGLGECDRGGGGAAPSCKGLVTNEDPDDRAEAKKEKGAVATFGAFLRGTLADKAHSGSARAPLDLEEADYYPVALSWDSLRPGTIYADPYGHVLVVAKRLPQTAERGGVLYAVDGQPDGTVARKRFWRGNFLYATDPGLGGPGFKRPRPIVRRGGRLLRLEYDRIRSSPDYGDLSLAAKELDVEGFYDAMDDVLAPTPLDPARAMREAIDALDEQVRARVKSVDNGREWLARATEAAPMPEGGEIFETTGAWEDFATPSRDLRLLIAIDVVRGFPARVARRPQRYAMTPGKPVKEIASELGALLTRELAARSIAYRRTDGSAFELTLAQVVARAGALEMAYNLNDCAEVRWGAAADTAEGSTCRAHAPTEQKKQMESYRAWFRERRRPARR